MEHSRSGAADTATARLRAWKTGYKTLPGIPDELIGEEDAPRETWAPFLDALSRMDKNEVSARFASADRHLREAGVSHRIHGQDRESTWPLSHLPLLLSESDWHVIATAVEQRATLLETILADIYGESKLVSKGMLPAAAVTGSWDYIRPMVGVKPPGGRYLSLYAADLGRGPDGTWWVLGDRTQAPSGAGYALGNRLVLSRAFPAIYKAMNVERLAPFFDAFRAGLSKFAERNDPRVCLLTPGPFSETYSEQAHLARYLGFLLVEGNDLLARDGRVFVRTIDGLKRADVLWRRVDADFIDPVELNSTSRLGVPGLIDAMRAGGVVVANAPGTGVVESRAMLSFMPALCREILGEDLKLPNIATWWCGQPREYNRVTRSIDDLAIGGAFGRLRSRRDDNPILAGDLSEGERKALLRDLESRPSDFVGQEVVGLSTTPVWQDGALAPRPFVLRVYAAATPDGWHVMPGGFCRISDQPDARALSMGEGARSADVWVLADKPVKQLSLLSEEGAVKVRRITGHLPSRAADNLFWLGRYLERLEAALRIVRSFRASLMESDRPLETMGEPLKHLQKLLIESGAAPKEIVGETIAKTISYVMTNDTSIGCVRVLLQSARRTASGMRDRFSADAWRMLDHLYASLSGTAKDHISETRALAIAEQGIEALAAFSGLAMENMNRLAGWRFLDIGRRIERGIDTCRFIRLLGDKGATLDDLGILLDLVDSQITYRSRYLEGVALEPVRDLVLLDPYNPRSVAFQIETLKQHLASLPSLRRDGLPEEPNRLLIRMASEIETRDAADMDAAATYAIERGLMTLSDAIGDRYFLQGPKARPSEKVSGLA